MRLLPLLLIAPMTCLLWAFQARALDASTQTLVKTGYVASKVTTAPFDRKLIVEAQDDAAVFIASDGAYRGARLESALMELRRSDPELNASDRELAQAILVQ